MGGKEAGGQDRIQAAVPAEQISRALGPDAASPGNPVGWITSQRDEIWHLLWIDAVAFPDLYRSNPRHLAGTNREKDGRGIGGKLKRITVAAGDEHPSAAPLFHGNRRRQKIIGFVARSLGVPKPACRYEFRQNFKLLDQRVVELTPALIAGQFLVPLGWRFEGVPSHKHGARLFGVVEAEQGIGKADDGACALAPFALNGLGQGVI